MVQEKLKTQMYRISFAAILAAMMVSQCQAGETPNCAVSTIPVQIVEVAKAAPWPSKSIDTEQNFRRFVTKITEHLTTLQNNEQQCLYNDDSNRASWLKFEKWPDFSAGNEPYVQAPSFDERPSGGCRITSPWIDIAVERKPKAWVRAVVRWNPRQMYVDQATLYGARNLPPGVALPLTYDEFSRFAQDYGIPGGDDAYYAEVGSIDEKRARIFELRARRKLADARTPPDLVWLFHRTPTSSPDPFTDEVRRKVHTRMSNHTDGYTQLVSALIDRCKAVEGMATHYESILDVADLISLEKYKMR